MTECVVGRCKCGAYGVVYDEATEKERGMCHEDLTKRMTWEDFLQTDEPVDQAELRWYAVEGYIPQVRERRAVFHFHTDWKDFHDKGKGTVGAPFVHSWSIEEPRGDGQWHCTGRTNRGWRELKLNPEGGDYATFPTEEEAKGFARGRCAARLAMHEGEVANLKARLKELG